MTTITDQIETTWQENKNMVYDFAYEFMGKNTNEAVGLQVMVFILFRRMVKKRPDLLDEKGWAKKFLYIATRNSALNRLRWLKHHK